MTNKKKKKQTTDRTEQKQKRREKKKKRREEIWKKKSSSKENHFAEVVYEQRDFSVGRSFLWRDGDATTRDDDDEDGRGERRAESAARDRGNQMRRVRFGGEWKRHRKQREEKKNTNRCEETGQRLENSREQTVADDVDVQRAHPEC